jgi:hypothetical protein
MFFLRFSSDFPTELLRFPIYIHFSVADVYSLRSDTFNTKPLNRTTSFIVTFSSLAPFLPRNTHTHGENRDGGIEDKN